jgi:peptide/nickel transport system substrate-binding protein
MRVKNSHQTLALLALTLLLVLFTIPILAQDADPGAGNGGTIVESNIGDDPSTFNPIITNDTTSATIQAFMFPLIIAADPVTLQAAPNAAGGLATGWEYDETGTVLTITLRQDAFWSDGTPITSADYMWSVNAIRSNLSSSPNTNVFYSLDDGTLVGGPLHNIVALDDYTVQVTLGDVVVDEAGEPVLNADGSLQLIPNCDALNQVNDIVPVPAHAFEAAFGSDYGSMAADPYFVASNNGVPVTWGPFTDPFIEFGVQTSLLADQSYPDTQLGYVAPSEWLLQQVEDQTVEYERFLAGDFSIIAVSPNNQNGIRGDDRFQTIEYPANGYTYMGYNLADPNNPQPGRDTEGNLLDQGIHPIFGDKAVRQAIAHAVNVLEMIGTRPEGEQPATGILAGNGFPQATHNHPGLSSVDPGVSPYEFDPDLAMQMLTDAGWTDEDGDGIRECHGCLYAATVDSAFEGSPMEFELLTNSGNVNREAAGETIRLQLQNVGIRVNYQAIEFGTLIDSLLSQQIDAIIIGWNLALPFNPGNSIRDLFGIGADAPGAGFNFMSYQNPEMERLLIDADTLPAAEDGSYPACDETTRNVMYAEAMRMLYEDQPYLWLFAGNTMIAAQGSLENFDPIPYNASWNIDAWTVSD